MRSVTRASDPIYLNGIMANMSAYLTGLAQKVTALEESISDQTALGFKRTAAEINALQNLDYLRQSLEDLSKLTHYLHAQCAAATLSQESSDALVEELLLQTVKRLVRCPSNEHGDTILASEQGVIDLF